MNLLDLATGNVSLEFRAAEFDAILSALKRFGKVRVQPHASHEIVSVDGEELILMNEWDDPCLISQTRAGKKLLQAVADEADGARVAAE